MIGKTNAGGSAVDIDVLSSEPERVVDGDTFMGTGIDEVQTGTMPNNGETKVSVGESTHSSDLIVRIPDGAYFKTEKTKENPYIEVAFSKIRAAIGLTDATTIMSGRTVLGLVGTGTNNAVLPEQYLLENNSGYDDGQLKYGTMKNMYERTTTTLTNADTRRVSATTSGWGEVTNSDGASRLLLQIPTTGYYTTSHCIGIARSSAASMIGLNASKILTGTTYLGVAGTYPDYTSGRVVFNYGTFDGTLVSGVSTTKGMQVGVNTFFPMRWQEYPDHYGYGSGVSGNGLGLYIYSDQNDGYDNYCSGYAFTSSIDLTPFSKIRVYYKPYDMVASGLPIRPTYLYIKCSVGKPSGTATTNLGKPIKSTASLASDSVTIKTTGDTFAGTNGTESYFDTDISGVSEQGYIAVGISGHVDSDAYTIKGTTYITKVELIN